MTNTSAADSGGDDQQALRRLHADHARAWRQFDYVYPVVSRRSRGLSIGVNVNVDTACNFDCVYCQVDRTQPPRRRDVDLDQLASELRAMIEHVVSGRIWKEPDLAGTPIELRRLNDIAFSGDGEPTAFPGFEQAVAIAADLRQQFTLSTTNLVLITNATLLDRPPVMRGLARLDGNGGQIWAKLDAGTDEYFRQVDRPRGGLSLERITANITAAARRRPIVIQTMLMRMAGQPMSDTEFQRYLDRLASVIDAGGVIAQVQLYTVVRQPAEDGVDPLTREQLDAYADRLRRRLPSVHCMTYG